MNFDVFNDKFPVINSDNFKKAVSFLKNSPQYDFDMLLTIIATDLRGKIELSYVLYSCKQREKFVVKITVDDAAQSVVDVFKSAYFDECEIYDLFGVNFLGNPDLKRLLLPESWVGHPLLKDYTQNDTRLAWNDASFGQNDASFGQNDARFEQNDARLTQNE